MRKTPSPFARAVYDLVSSIPKGHVMSYGQVAIVLGHPRGARAVGWILHWHPHPETIPWHRVINRDGYISTTCQEHPKRLQEALLRAEDIVVDEHLCVDMRKYQWQQRKR